MSWSLAIKALFDALTAYLQLKVHSLHYDMLQKSRAVQLSYEQQIEKLRSTGKPADADAADLVRIQLIAEKQFAQHLPTLNPQTSTGTQNTNS